ncbi:MAG TPA: ribonuclease P protein component [Candidatus Saccharimonadales bacterium]|nr:ribonuclease P protein component [Candidatus Saccharimonadales bacterium]
MIGQRNRFHGYGSLRAVYQRGRTVRGPLMSLKYNDRGPGRAYRAAVVVSRKVHKSAVTRNRIRRRLYEIIRLADSRLTDHKDLVLTVFSDRAAELESDKLRAMVEDLLAQAADPKHR